MKLAFVIALLTALSTAAPAPLEKRQSSGNELENGRSDACPSAILIFARGSVEPGNLGLLLGPPLASALRSKVSGIWIQGVGGPYTAGLFDNQQPRGTKETAIAEGVRLYNLAHTKCPEASILTAGYSQGSALVAAAISDLTPAVRDKVKGAVLFGYTKMQANEGKIPNYPVDKTLVFCAKGDDVCDKVNPANPLAHFSYGDEAKDEAPTFLAARV